MGNKAKCAQQQQSYSGLTMMMGRGMHTSGQRDGCKCVPEAKERAAFKRYLTWFYGKYNSLRTETEIDALLEKKFKAKKMFKKTFQRHWMVLDLWAQYSKAKGVGGSSTGASGIVGWRTRTDDEQSGLTEEELVMADHFGDTVQPFTMK